MGFLDISNVTKSYGAVEVLHRVDISVEEGEFLVLVGPSGCGKSTLLNMIAGLEGISGGEISIRGRVMNGVHPSRRNIAMVFQSYALYPNMTVGQNMTFGLEMHGIPKPERDKALAEVSKLLQIDHLLDRKPGQLSGGQRQRVAMGRALVRDPDVFLFDEPLSNLDAKLRVEMRTEIKELHQRLKTTTVYVTHDQIEAMTMADKIVVMQDGIVEQMGAPLELYDKPDNKFVAGFIGSPAMNFLDGTLKVNGGQPYVETANGAKLPVAVAPPNGNGRPVSYGIRPEHLAFADTGIEAEVVVVEPTGSETQIVARVGHQEVIAVFRERHPVAPGDLIYLQPRAEVAHLFDRETGKRL